MLKKLCCLPVLLVAMLVFPLLCGAAPATAVHEVFMRMSSDSRVLVARVIPVVATSSTCCDDPEYSLRVTGANCSVACDQPYETAQFCDGTQVEFKAPGPMTLVRKQHNKQIYRYSSGDCDGSSQVEVRRHGRRITVDYDK